MECPNCHAEVNEGLTVCPACGEEVVPKFLAAPGGGGDDRVVEEQPVLEPPPFERVEVVEEQPVVPESSGPYLELVGTQKVRPLDGVTSLIVGRLDDTPTIWDMEPITLAPSPGRISRSHCTFVLAGMIWHVMDLGASNGTWLNDQRLDPGQMTPLADGDKVIIDKGGQGETWILFHAAA